MKPKFCALGVLVASVILAGCEARKPFEPADTSTPMEKPTSTATVAPTDTPLLLNLSFQAFHDFNGNGILDEGEPTLEGITNRTPARECTTGADGKCEIDPIPAKSYKISVADNRDVSPEQKMRYILPSASEVIPISQGFSPIKGNDELRKSHLDVLVPLAQGYVTWPLKCGEKWTIFAEFDLIPGPGLRTWDSRGYDYSQDHYGTDIAARKGTEIIAGAPGRVTVGNNGRGALFIDIRITGTDLVLSAGHVEPNILVKDGEKVLRGQPIGAVGNTGTSSYHIHYGVNHGETWFDLYRDPTNPSSLGYWTVDNSPQCLK